MSVATITARSPFAAKFEQSKANQAARAAAIKAQADTDEANRLSRLAAEQANAAKVADEARAQRHASAPQTFGRGFLEAVANRIMNPGWSPEYFLQVQAYAEGLLFSKTDPQLPQINPRHAEAILEKFSYGLRLAKQFDRPVPKGLFYGQRLLAQKAEETEREARAKAEAKEAALVIRKGVRPRGPRPAPAVDASIELAPAITPAGKRKAPKKG